MLAPYYVPMSNKAKDSKVPYYGIYAANPERDRMTFQKFNAIYAAKHFVLLMIDGDEYRWDVRRVHSGDTGKAQIITSRGVIIHTFGDDLEEIMEHEFTSEEASFVFPEPEHSKYARFPRLGKQGPALTTDEDYEDTQASRTSAPDDAPQPKVKREPRPSKEGLVTIADICAEIKLEPKAARDALRKSELEKPAAGWAFPAADVPDVINTIIGNLKAGISYTVTTKWGNKPLKGKK